MVPPSSHGIPRVPRYSGYHASTPTFTYGTLTLFGLPSHAVLLVFIVLKVVRTPKTLLSQVWPLPRSLATTCGISVDFFSSPYLDVSVQAVPPIYLFIQYMVTGLYPAGLLHSEICGSTCICHSPQLIAAYHVLHRLPVPRHSPCALSLLTFLRVRFSSLFENYSFLVLVSSAIVVFYPNFHLSKTLLAFLPLLSRLIQFSRFSKVFHHSS